MFRWLSTHYLYILLHQWVHIQWLLIKLVFFLFPVLWLFLPLPAIWAFFKNKNSRPVITSFPLQVMVQTYLMCTVWGEPLSQTSQSFMPELIYGVNRSLSKVSVSHYKAYSDVQSSYLWFLISLVPSLRFCYVRG